MSFDTKVVATSPEVSPCLKERDLSDYAFFPVQYPEIEELFERQNEQHWVPGEIDFTGDRDDWNRLPEVLRHVLKFILAFFAQADGIISENAEGFKEAAKEYKEIGWFYTAQQNMENIHSKTYALTIQNLVSDSRERTKLLNGIQSYKEVEEIAKWSLQWMDSTKHSFPERIVAVACIEGVIFSSTFAVIYWVKNQGILKGMCKANELIARDEALHTEGGVKVYKHITTKGDCRLSKKRVHAIIRSAVDVAEKFTRGALHIDEIVKACTTATTTQDMRRSTDEVRAEANEELIGMSFDGMMKYVKATADELSKQLGYGKIYNEENPFAWMSVISLDNKTNFHEEVVTEYSKANSEGGYKFDADF